MSSRRGVHLSDLDFRKDRVWGGDSQGGKFGYTDLCLRCGIM